MKHTNALVREKSPYLLQHAHNPVNWLPWGDEAFEIARREDKPVLVSIGYSTCHWCHVMERESFENEDIAAQLNDAFVCIKVDREERPDIDAVYMNVCHLLTGSGGWPLNVVVSPDKKPFFAATYIPATSRHGRYGLNELVPRITHLWKNEREQVLESAEGITHALEKMEMPGGHEPLDVERLVRQVYNSLTNTYDRTHGGFGQSPKFPSAHTLLFLIQRSRRSQDANARWMAVLTLRAMRNGGLWDHIGYGFHRYSTDARWLLPHFEKMLYDQALLALAYVEAHQLTGKEEFSKTARNTFEYVLRDMRDEKGGFYTAEDADSEGKEGLFYTWTWKELHEALAPEEAKLFCDHYNIKPDGNFHDEATDELTGRNIPHEISSPPAAGELEAIRKKLFALREMRIRPHLDDKILADLNGLMIAALARGGRALGDDTFTTAAIRAAEFILSTLSDADGRLKHGYRECVLNAPGTLDDSAFMLWGLLELYETTFDETHLTAAEKIADAMLEAFEDKVNGGFFLTSEHGETVLVRQKPIHDAAIPSGTSVALQMLVKLGVMLDRQDFKEAARRCASWAAEALNRMPQGLIHMAAGLETLFSAPESVVVAGPMDASETRALLDILHSQYKPGLNMRLQATDRASGAKASGYALELQSLGAVAGAWVCRDYKCEQPVITPEALRRALEE